MSLLKFVVNLWYNIFKDIVVLRNSRFGVVDTRYFVCPIYCSEKIISMIRRRVEFLAPVHCYSGENEMEALAAAALAVLRGEMKAQQYI